MKASLVNLNAFPDLHPAATSPYRVKAGAEFDTEFLYLQFELSSGSSEDFGKLILPEANTPPSRKNGLWKETCFECFIPTTRSECYLEFNGSPTGDWNLYAFKRYREGMTEFDVDAKLSPQQTRLIIEPKKVITEWRIPLKIIEKGFESVGESNPVLQKAGLTVVLCTSIATTYWAIEHKGAKPDFHLETSFVYPL